jgi:hypothetical protein
VGNLVGDCVGELVGDLVGDHVGAFVGDTVGVLVGDFVGEGVAARRLYAASACNKPNPWLSSRPGSPRSIAESIKACRTSSADLSGK